MTDVRQARKISRELIPHVTAPLDTSGTTSVGVNEQIDVLLNYTQNNTPTEENVIENPPENRVTEDDANGTSDAASLSTEEVADPEGDYVGGTSLSDGVKDTSDHLEETPEVEYKDNLAEEGKKKSSK